MVITISLLKLLSYFTFMTLLSAQSRDNSSLNRYWQEVKGSEFNSTGNERIYYIAADEVVWDYAPAGYNMISDEAWDEMTGVFAKKAPGRIGSKYLKCIFREYTDDNFINLKNRSGEEAYLGFIGPILYAEVGDYIKVYFKNNCRFNATMHAHGVFYGKDTEGDLYNDRTNNRTKSDDNVPYGQQYTYTWYVPERAGPGPSDGTSIIWPYQSDVENGINSDTGAIGFISVTAHGLKGPSNLPVDVDLQVYFLFSMTDENRSPYLAYNLKKFGESPFPSLNDQNFTLSNQKFNINGYIYGNGPSLELKYHSRVRWSITSGEGFHSPHWHGNVVLDDGKRKDVVGVLPMETITVDMVPDNNGVWIFHCHVMEHMMNGMSSLYMVSP